MIRLLLREAVLTAIVLAAVSVAAFALLDATGAHDWAGVADAAARAGIHRDVALGRTLPAVWNGRVADARRRTQDDLAALEDTARRDAARHRLRARGTAALPVMLARLRRLPPSSLPSALDLLAEMAPRVTGGEHPPTDPTAALDYWDRFEALRGLDFRLAYAERLVQRLAEHESRNAAEQLVRLGTFALPAIFDELTGPIDGESAQRLTEILAEITGRPLRVPPGATVSQTRAVLEAWRAWWLTERLEYEQLTGIAARIAPVVETRYGRWVTHALVGELGQSAATGQPIARELRVRLPRSAFTQGLGGLLATALVVAFGGGAVLRRRPLRTKLLDLTGALIPGLIAFGFALAALLQLCATPRPVGPLAREVFTPYLRLATAVVLATPVAVAWLRRRGARVTLHAVRHEAESWARDRRDPRVGQIVRHGLRVGAASLLAPLGLSAAALVAVSLVVEPVVGVDGMAALTVASLRHWDPSWLLVATLSLVPMALGVRWARQIMIWSLGGRADAASDESAPAEDEEADGAPHADVPPNETATVPSPPPKRAEVAEARPSAVHTEPPA